MFNTNMCDHACHLNPVITNLTSHFPKSHLPTSRQPGHQAGVAYVNMGSIHAWTARRIILASTPRIVLASIISPATALRPIVCVVAEAGNLKFVCIIGEWRFMSLLTQCSLDNDTRHKLAI